jgi:hypothetical protein
MEDKNKNIQGEAQNQPQGTSRRDLDPKENNQLGVPAKSQPDVESDDDVKKANAKRAHIPKTTKTIMDFQDNTSLKEDEDQIDDQGGPRGSVPPGYKDDQDQYA